MVGQPAGSIPAFRWHRLPRACLAFSLFIGIGIASAPTAMGKALITLVLPSRVSISLASGKTISGVRLTALDSSQLSYEKGGKRSLPVREVRSISFSGPVSLEATFRKPIRGFQISGCRGPREMPIPGSALLVVPNGDALALDPAILESTVSKDLQQASSVNILVVSALRFDPDGKVRLEYKSCSPGK